MGNEYRLAVLLSTYNGARYIEEQLNSVFHQEDIENIRIIVRDDGSQDETVSIIQRLQETHSELELICGTNIGLVRSFFELLHLAVMRGYDYISFCDQDDYWLPKKLACAVHSLQAEGDDGPLLYGCCSKIVNEKLEETGYETQHRVRPICFYNTAIQNICPGHNQVMNLKLAAIIAERSVDLGRIYSQDLWMANAAAVVGKIVFDNTSHTLYRNHSENQLGYGAGAFRRLKTHLARLRKDECAKMVHQLFYAVEVFHAELPQQQTAEIMAFRAGQRTAFSRFRYALQSRLYRQSKKETLAFRLLYLLGRYQVDEYAKVKK